MKITTTLIAAAALALASPLAAEIVSCSSNDHNRNYCRVDTHGGVVLVHQESRAGCYRNDTWGYDRHGIWVANGCRATFRVGYSGSERNHSIHYNHHSNRDYHEWERDHNNYRYDDDDDSDKKKAIGAAIAIGLIAAAAKNAHDDKNDGGYGRSIYKCESKNYRYQYCSVPGRVHHVELKRQLSSGRDGQCRYGRQWGYDRGGIWVNSGCRAEFWVD